MAERAKPASANLLLQANMQDWHPTQRSTSTTESLFAMGIVSSIMIVDVVYICLKGILQFAPLQQQ
jgi:hypothetical protein